jgi:hypothetical protein
MMMEMADQLSVTLSALADRASHPGAAGERKQR